MLDAARENRRPPEGCADRAHDAGHAARDDQLAKHQPADVARGEAVDGRHEQILPPLRAELVEEGRAERRGEERVRAEQALRVVELRPDDERQREQGQEPEAEEQVKADLQQPEPARSGAAVRPSSGPTPRVCSSAKAVTPAMTPAVERQRRPDDERLRGR